MSRRHTLRPLLLATCIALGTSTTACAQSRTSPDIAVPADATLLSVSASADVQHAPDVAGISAGVVTQAADANAAMRANAGKMQKVMAAIHAAGIADKDIRTSGINLNPQYRYADNQPPTITGYQASNNVELKVRDLGNLGKALDALVASGANQVNGPSFDIDQADAVQDQARRAALEKAQARAQLYAQTLGLRVRRVVSISEGGGFQPPMPRPMMRMKAMEAVAADSPVAPGENTVSASVDVVFELGK